VLDHAATARCRDRFLGCVLLVRDLDLFDERSLGSHLEIALRNKLSRKFPPTPPESRGNEDAVIEPTIVRAVAGCLRPEFESRGIELIEAFDNLPLRALLNTMRPLLTWVAQVWRTGVHIPCVYVRFHARCTICISTQDIAGNAAVTARLVRDRFGRALQRNNHEVDEAIWRPEDISQKQITGSLPGVAELGGNTEDRS
jgi:hypothetical protein